MATSALVVSKVPGRIAVKTRLRASLGISDAAATVLARAFLADTLCAVSGCMFATRFLALDPLVQAAELAELLAGHEIPPLEAFTIIPQPALPFGERIAALFATAMAGKRGAVAVGSDAPILTASTVRRAKRLTDTGHVVLGPAPSGGLYLIGLPAHIPLDRIPPLFDRPDATELEAFARELSAYAPVRLLAPQFDIDTADDLVSVHAILGASAIDGAATAPNTRAALCALGTRFVRGGGDNRRTFLEIRGEPGEEGA